MTDQDQPIPALRQLLTNAGIDPETIDLPAVAARAFHASPTGPQPRPWVADPAALRTVAQQHQMPAGISETAHNAPCPTWCEHTGAEHRFTFTDPPRLHLADEESEPQRRYRIHRHRLGPNPTHVAVELRERRAAEHGPSDLGTDPEALTIALYVHRSVRPHGDTSHAQFTATGARELARQLIAGADLADTETRTWAHPNGATL